MQLKILNYPLFYSASIGEKSRENLLKNLNDHLVNLACSKHGSRSIDAIWNKARTTISYWKKKYETISKLKYSRFHSYMTLVYRTIKNAMQKMQKMVSLVILAPGLLKLSCLVLLWVQKGFRIFWTSPKCFGRASNGKIQ
jgi:hypothetical protein